MDDDDSDLDAALRLLAKADPRPIPGGIVADRFEIVSVAGRGGFGTVYRAIERPSGRDVALKLMRHGATDRARFEREAEVLSTLRHPSIVSHVAHGVTPEDASFLAMEWLDGIDLAQRLSLGRLSTNEALALGIQAAQGLAAAHRVGVIHRDVKPSNLYLVGCSVDDVRVLDFGVARASTDTNAPHSDRQGSRSFVGAWRLAAPRTVGARRSRRRADRLLARAVTPLTSEVIAPSLWLPQIGVGGTRMAFIDASGTKLSYRDGGRGDPVVLVASQAVPCDIWNYNVPSLVEAGRRLRPAVTNWREVASHLVDRLVTELSGLSTPERADTVVLEISSRPSRRSALRRTSRSRSYASRRSSLPMQRVEPHSRLSRAPPLRSA